MKTLTKLALAAVLAVGVVATFSTEASAKGHHSGSHHGSHSSHHHKHHHHNVSHKHHHGSHGHHHHKHHSFSYGFGGYAPSKSFKIIYIPVELDFIGVR